MLIPGKMKELEIESLRTHNKLTEHKRDFDGLINRFKKLEDLQGQATSINDKLKRID